MNTELCIWSQIVGNIPRQFSDYIWCTFERTGLYSDKFYSIKKGQKKMKFALFWHYFAYNEYILFHIKLKCICMYPAIPCNHSCQILALQTYFKAHNEPISELSLLRIYGAAKTTFFKAGERKYHQCTLRFGFSCVLRYDILEKTIKTNENFFPTQGLFQWTRWISDGRLSNPVPNLVIGDWAWCYHLPLQFWCRSDEIKQREYLQHYLPDRNTLYAKIRS